MVGFLWTRQSNKYDKAVYSIESQLDACREAARADGIDMTVHLCGPVVPFDQATLYLN